MSLRSFGARLASRLAGLRSLPNPAELVLFVQVVAVASVVPLVVRLSLPRQAALLTPRGTRRSPATADRVDRVVRCVELAQQVARPLVRGGCLTRGLTLYWFLGRADDGIDLCFGLGHPAASDDYSGHCWLTREGQPFLERVDPTGTFGVVYRIGAASP